MLVRRIVLLLPLILVLTGTEYSKRQRIDLPTSKFLLSPSPGRLATLNSFPEAVALSPDARYAAVLNAGYGIQETQVHQSISVLDLDTNQLADFPDARLSENAHQSYFLGLAFSSDGRRLFASLGSITDPTGEKPGDTGNGIAVYSFRDGQISPERFIKIPPQALGSEKTVALGLFKLPAGQAIPYPAGIAVVHGPNGDRLLVANNLSDNAILLEVASGQILKSFDLSTNRLVPSSFPYTVVASRDGRRAWCSLWNASRIAELDLEKGSVVRWITPSLPDPPATGTHPTALLLSPDEKSLYVALSNADAVAVIDPETGATMHLLSATLPKQNFAGNYPSALALAPDGSRLFVAASAINAVEVFDVRGMAGNTKTHSSSASPLGFIPTNWYPSAVAVKGDDLLVAAAKGQGSGPNNGANALATPRRHREHPYIATLLRGSLARLNFRKAEENLAELTREVEDDNLVHSDPGKIDFRSGQNPIRHVIYIIKENRTYDQVLGDLKVGNGDPSLTLYGEDITPNEHKLALQFGVLDNFYDSGEVSGDGHVWSTAAITSDYNEKTWQIAYRGKERTYDFQGTVAEEYALDYDETDVDDPGTGFLWGNLARARGLTYRDYGEFINGEWCSAKRGATVSPKQGTSRLAGQQCPRNSIAKGEALPPNLGQPHGSASPWPWAVPLVRRMIATKAELRDHFDPLFPDFNVDYPDQLRADEFLNEFGSFVRARQEHKGTELPNFVLLYLPDDHTGGTRPGGPKPAASVADNDLALGRVVEAVSHSAYWDDTAIFVLEDDAQDGADHVDAHRSIAFVISKYSPGSLQRPFVAHQFYTTVNMVHTMEALLRLPPMNQNDAYAPLMAPLFAGPGTQPAFTADTRNRDNGLIYQVNPPRVAGGLESKTMDFSHPDAAPAARLNAILWRDRKGDTPMPAPQHRIFTAR